MARFNGDEDDVNALRLKLKNALGDGYEVEAHKEVSALVGYVKEVFDLVVFYHEDAICGIECQPDLLIISSVFQFRESYISRFQRVGLRYGIIYYGNDQKIYFWVKGKYGFEEFDFNDMVIAIKGNQECGKRPTTDDIVKEFGEFIPEGLNDKKDDISRLFADNIEYDEKSASMWLNRKAEDDLFRLLLQGKGNEYENVCGSKHVCRYTTLNSLFNTMKDGNHVMCSITCMNDKGETSYADKYVGYESFAISSKSIEENNECFILSFCDKEPDDLTMWRLYGNDGKGVCLEYDVNCSKIDEEEFFLAPVSYGESMKEHPSLDLIKRIRLWNKCGWRFELKRWYIWKHFFKSYLFKDENEVRLLFVWNEDNCDTVEWIMDSTNSIVSRICKFPIDNDRLPLTLTRVIIGPKCPEQASHVDQFNYMNRQLKIVPDTFLKPAVISSKIEDYR